MSLFVGARNQTTSLSRDSLDSLPWTAPSITLRPAKPLYEEGVVFARYLDAIAPFY